MFVREEWICDDVEHIVEMIEYYQPKLGIADWAIRLAVKNQIDVPNEGVAASYSLLARRLATIELSRTDSREATAMKEDAEQSLVHELLHITFAAWHDHARATLKTNGVEYNVCCEQPIDQLAETLVLMRRSSGHQFSFEQHDQQQG